MSIVFAIILTAGIYLLVPLICLSINQGKYTKKKALIRYIIVGVIMVIAFTFNIYISVITTFVGIMSIKFSAYAQPLTHIIIKKIKNKRKVKS